MPRFLLRFRYLFCQHFRPNFFNDHNIDPRSEPGPSSGHVKQLPEIITPQPIDDDDLVSAG
jgi:hypothetical protein